MYRNPLYPLKTLSFQLLDPEKSLEDFHTTKNNYSEKWQKSR